MDITSSQAKRHSEQDFSRKLSTYIDSGAGIVHVRTGEIIRASIAVRRQAILDGFEVKEWDTVNGFRTFTGDNLDKVTIGGDGNIDIGSAFNEPLISIRDNPDTPRYYIFICPHVFMENNPTMNQLLLTYSHSLPETAIAVILITPDTPLPVEVDANILSLQFEPPGHAELKESLDRLLASVTGDVAERIEIDDEELDKVCFTGAGMALNNFEMYAALSITEASRGADDDMRIGVDDLIRGVSVGKTDVVNSSDILELYPTSEITDVGGLENLKEWVGRRKECYSDAAKDFGIEPPKGLVLVGPPGTGKSLTAKAVSKELGVPLVRLDFGRVFNSLVGASEQRMRTALQMVEVMAPCVLFCDEIDKGLGGIGGSGDSGTSNRVLGSFLTWLQDCKAPVFVMVTANNVTGLPPEMLRRGRFDAIFSTTLPNAREREEVLSIHLKKRGRDIEDIAPADVEAIVLASDGYVPAEIESAVKDALVDAFDAGDEMGAKHILKALKAMVPLSKAFARQIADMNEWAKNNATPASKDLAEVKARAGEPRTRLGARQTRTVAPGGKKVH